MLSTFDNPRECMHLIVSLPEEMPLRESLELSDHLFGLFPENKPEFLANRIFPEMKSSPLHPDPHPERWKTPVADNGEDYAVKRALLEKSNLRSGTKLPRSTSSWAMSLRWLQLELPARRIAWRGNFRHGGTHDQTTAIQTAKSSSRAEPAAWVRPLSARRSRFARLCSEKAPSSSRSIRPSASQPR